MNYDEFNGDDLEYLEQFVLKWRKEERELFFARHPEFLKDYPLNPLKTGSLHLLEDENYRGIMRKVKLLNC